MYKKHGNFALGIRIALAVIAFVLVAGLVTVLIINRNDLTLENVKATIASIWTRDDEADSFTFNSGSSTVYADVDGGFAVASSLGVQVFDKSGAETTAFSQNMSQPVLQSSGTAGVGYDVGGYKLCVFGADGQKYALETTQKVISAAVNENAWLAVCTQEQGYDGSVTIYNSDGKAVYKWYSGTAYTTFAAVSANNGYMAALTLNESGSRLVMLALDSEDELCSVDLSGETAMGVKFVSKDTAQVLTDKRIITVDKSGKTLSEYDYSDKYISGFSIEGEGGTYIVYGDNKVDDGRNIAVLDGSGQVVGQLTADEDITDVSAAGNFIAVLYNGHVTIYNSDMSEYADIEYSGSGSRIIARSDGTAAVIFEHTATVLRSGGKK